MVETQLSNLRGTSDTFVGRASSIRSISLLGKRNCAGGGRCYATAAAAAIDDHHRHQTRPASITPGTRTKHAAVHR